LAHIWVLDIARGLAFLLFVATILAFPQKAYFLILFALAIYLLLDGALDLVLSARIWRRRARAPAVDEGVEEPLRVASGLLSICIGLLAFRLGSTFFVYLIIYLGLRTAAQGGGDIWRSVSSARKRRAARDYEALAAAEESDRFLWLVGAAKVLIGLALVALSPTVLSLSVIYFTLYFAIEGIAFLCSGLLKVRRARVSGAGRYMGGSQLAAPDAAVPIVDPSAPGARRAVAFVRRAGAAGMGHAGWAFEWQSGYFNAGSVENRSSAAFTPPEHMDFWTAQTRDPVATMLKQSGGYDEYKVFVVAQPQPREAWQVVVWVSRQPYSVARRNCADATYDVLRAFGAVDLPDTAAKPLPNEWYDALPGSSYRISEHPAIPLRPELATRLQQRAEEGIAFPDEIALHIGAHVATSPPAWRGAGGRARYEVTSRVEYINEQALDVLVKAFDVIRRPFVDLLRAETVPTGGPSNSARAAPLDAGKEPVDKRMDEYSAYQLQANLDPKDGDFTTP
jgi:hypothetical protein